MSHFGIRTRRRRLATLRRGTTTVEFAVCLPLVLLLFFGSIEFSRVNMLRHTIGQAAYEGARRGIVPGATADQVRSVATDVLSTASAASFSIDVVPATISENTTQVTVNISLPFDQNRWSPSLYLSGSTLSKSFTMQRERLETTTVP